MVYTRLKTKSIVLTAAFVLVFSLFAPGMQHVAKAAVLVSDDFESAVIGQAPAGWNTMTDGGTITVEQVADGTNPANQAMKIRRTTLNQPLGASKSFPAATGQVTFELRMRAAQTDALMPGPKISNSSGAELIDLAFRDTGAFGLLMSGWTTIRSYSDHQWYEIRIEANTDTDTFDLYIDNTLELDDQPFKTATNDVAQISFSPYSWDNGTAYYDNIQVSQGAEGENLPPSATDVSISGTPTAGETLTGNYTYYDADSDPEGATSFQWYRGAAADGTGKSAIAGATGSSYTVSASDEGLYLFFEVTPKAASGASTGIAVSSAPVWFEAPQGPNTYYVDAVNGSDTSGNGSSDNPWQTIGRAAAVADAGDTVKIRSGVYRETVTPAHSGTAGNPVIFEADEGAAVTVSGADLVTGSWTVHAGNVYKTTKTLSMGTWKNQVFVDGVAMNLARWPNAGTDPMNPVFKEADSGTDNSKIVDSELTQPDGYWNGAGVVVGDHYRWSIASATIASYTTGQLNLGSITTFGLGVNNGHGSPYYLIGKLAALDSANEWYYDSGSTTLYLQTPTGDSPANHVVEVKARSLAFNLNDKDYIHIKGIKLFANTLNTNSSHDVVIDGIDAKYVSHYELSHIGGEHQWPLSGIQLGGDHNVLKNSTVAYSPGNLVSMGGEHNEVVNNVMHDAAYGPAYTTNQANVYVNGKDLLISHNTLYNSGREVIAGSPDNARIQYNHGYNAMKLTDDGGFMYFSGTDGNGTEIHHNVLQGATSNPPHHVVGGIYLDFGAFDFKVFNNVVSDVNTFGVFFHSYNLFTQAYSNTFYNVSKFRMKDDGGALDAYGTRVLNNIAYDDMSIAPGFGILEKSNFTSGDPKFVNAANGDFHLQSSSTAIDAGEAVGDITAGYAGSGPDIGAYESGGTNWTAGHNFSSPPNPAFTTTDIPYQQLLTNGFFERQTDTVGGWTKTNAQTAEIARSGNDTSASRHAWTRGLKLGSVADGVEQTVTGLSPNTEYELRGFGKAVTSSQSIRIGVMDYGGADQYEEVTSTSWTKKKLRFTTGASDTSATVYIYKPTTGGYAYADDVTLVEVDPEAPDEIDYGNEDPGDNEPGVTVVNDADKGTGLNQYEFVGNWLSGPNIHAYNGDVTFSNTTNDYYQVRFEGKQIKLYSELSNIMGIVGVSVDGGAETMLDLYATEEEAGGNVLVYTSPELTSGPHTLKVRIPGTKNAASGGTWHVADRVEILLEGTGSPTDPGQEIEEVYAEDFESTEVGSLPEGWTVSPDDPASVTEDASGNRSLTMTESGNGVTSSAGVEFTPVLHQARVDLRVMAEQTSRSSSFLTLMDGNGAKVLELLFDNDYDSSGRHNIARRTPDGNWSTLMPYNVDQWYDISVEIDLDGDTYGISIDGDEAAAGIPLLSASEDIARYGISAYRWDAGTYHVDDIHVAGVVSEPEPEPEYGELYAEDFESTAVGAVPEGWAASADDPVSVTEDVYGNRRLTIAESGNGTTSSAVLDFAPVEDKIGVDLRVMAEQIGKANDFLVLKDSGGNRLLSIMFDQDYDHSGRHSFARRTPDGNWSGLMPYNANQWYDVHVEANLGAGTYSVAIDGVEVAEDIPLLYAASDVAQYSAAPHRWDPGTYHIDDLRISGPLPDEPDQVEVSAISVTSESGNAILTGIGETLQMVAAVDPDNAANPSVTWSVVGENGEAADAAGIDADGLLTALADGVVRVVAAANDGSGVTGESRVTIDSTAPAIATPEQLTFLQTEPIAVAFAAEDSLSGLQSLQVVFNGETAEIPLAFDPLALSVGAYAIAVTAADAAGNVSESAFELVVTMDIDHLDELVRLGYEQGSIDNFGIKTAMLAIVSLVQQGEEHEHEHVVQSGLKALKQLAAAQRGKHIDEAFADLVITDLDGIQEARSN